MEMQNGYMVWTTERGGLSRQISEPPLRVLVTALMQEVSWKQTMRKEVRGEERALGDPSTWERTPAVLI